MDRDSPLLSCSRSPGAFYMAMRTPLRFLPARLCRLDVPTARQATAAVRQNIRAVGTPNPVPIPGNLSGRGFGVGAVPFSLRENSGGGAGG